MANLERNTGPRRVGSRAYKLRMSLENNHIKKLSEFSLIQRSSAMLGIILVVFLILL